MLKANESFDLTDNQAEVGTHVFEKSGLGKAPFRCVGCYQDIGPHVSYSGGCRVEVGSPGQAMGTCKHCGMGIADCYVIRSADGKEFTVGSTCVLKTGDAGLIKSYKNSPEVRKLAAMKRQALDARKSKELQDLIAANEAKLASMTVKRYDGSTESQLDYLKRVLPWCGAAGRSRYLSHVRKLVA